MNAMELYRGLIADAIAPVIRRAVHPETTFFNGADLPKQQSLLAYAKRMGHEVKRPLAPRDRLAARLSLMLALTECKNNLMKEMLADTEAIEDAKKHKTLEA